MIKELWALTDNGIAVRFVYESRDVNGQGWRSHGNRNWWFDADGYKAEGHAGINDAWRSPKTGARSVGPKEAGPTTIRD